MDELLTAVQRGLSFFANVFAETRTRYSLKIPEKWGFCAWTCLRRQMLGEDLNFSAQRSVTGSNEGGTIDTPGELDDGNDSFQQFTHLGQANDNQRLSRFDLSVH